MTLSTRGLRSAAVAVLTTLALTTGASAQTAVTPAAMTLTQIRIDNFARVNDSYFRGAQPIGQDYIDLAALGIKTVINLTSDEDGPADERGDVEQAGMKYVHIPMSTRRAPTDKELTAFFAVVGDPSSGPVYVHCVGGRHRTGVMTAVYRMAKDGISGEQAFKEMKQYKYGPDFLHPEFKQFVYSYHAPKTAAIVTSGNQQ